MGDWNDLPGDLLLSIGDYLNTYIDYVRFRAVCCSWRRNLPKWPKHFFYNLPSLMLSYDDVWNEKLRGFYNPLNHEVYYLELFEIRYLQNCRGSSNGWLVIMTDGVTLRLFNPLTKSQIQLPPVSSFPDIIAYDPSRYGREYTIIDLTYNPCNISRYYIHNQYMGKIVLSSSTPSNDFIAVAIYGLYEELAFTKFGDDKWTVIPTSLNRFQDCIFFDEKILAINNLGELVVSPIDNPTQVVNLHLIRPKLAVGSKLYLVERDDGLLMVERLVEIVLIPNNVQKCRSYKTVGFNLFKLNLHSDRWLKINNLDGYTIFLGLNTSICISSKYCPKLKGNRIYYTYDEMDSRGDGSLDVYDFGVFDMTDKSCQSLLPNYDHSNLFVWSHPIWVAFNPC